MRLREIGFLPKWQSIPLRNAGYRLAKRVRNNWRRARRHSIADFGLRNADWVGDRLPVWHAATKIKDLRQE